ncbi:MAG: VOC family protein [Gammaproteobacteria bacterium]|nr:VOC family protein [Gammaproteobacteria bacterium]
MNGDKPAHGGIRHVALFVADLKACVRFYVDVLGYTVEWHPDADNIYLTSGTDNLALHRRTHAITERGRLDHIGVVLRTHDDVDRWHDYCVSKGVKIEATPKTHRDGARSFYCTDPDGTVVQFICHPPIAARI